MDSCTISLICHAPILQYIELCPLKKLFYFCFSHILHTITQSLTIDE